MEIAQIIDDALYEWYSEQGREVPAWKKSDPKWWQEYLKSLGMDPNNPLNPGRDLLLDIQQNKNTCGI